MQALLVVDEHDLVHSRLLVSRVPRPSRRHTPRPPILDPRFLRAQVAPSRLLVLVQLYHGLDGNAHGKRTSTPQFAFHPHGVALGRGVLANERQTQPAAAVNARGTSYPPGRTGRRCAPDSPWRCRCRYRTPSPAHLRFPPRASRKGTPCPQPGVNFTGVAAQVLQNAHRSSRNRRKRAGHPEPPSSPSVTRTPTARGADGALRRRHDVAQIHQLA